MNRAKTFADVLNDYLALGAWGESEFVNRTRLHPTTFAEPRHGLDACDGRILKKMVMGGTVNSSFTTNATDFAMALGGGLDVRVGERVGLRVFQLDYNPVSLRDRSISVLGGAGAIQQTRLESNRQDNIRLGFGITFK
jgi:hypothetical protein